MCAAADLISTVEWDATGELFATGDKGGRVVVFRRDHSLPLTQVSYYILHPIQNPSRSNASHFIPYNTIRIIANSNMCAVLSLSIQYITIVHSVQCTSLCRAVLFSSFFALYNLSTVQLIGLKILVLFVSCTSSIQSLCYVPNTLYVLQYFYAVVCCNYRV